VKVASRNLNRRRLINTEYGTYGLRRGFLFEQMSPMRASDSDGPATGKSYTSSPLPAFHPPSSRAFIPDPLSPSGLRLRRNLSPGCLSQAAGSDPPVSAPYWFWKVRATSNLPDHHLPPTFRLPSQPIMNGSQLRIEGCRGCSNRPIRASELLWTLDWIQWAYRAGHRHRYR
jgi:hypothetical protein